MKNKLKEYYKKNILGEDDNKVVDSQKSLHQLVLWIVFIVAVLIFIGVSNNFIPSEDKKNNSNQIITFETLDNIFSIYKDNYSYDISINSNDTIKAKYQGSVVNSIDNGKKIVDNEVTAYKIENNVITDINTNEVINNLYEEYLSYFFMPQNVYTYLKDVNYDEEMANSMKMYKYKTIYQDDDIIFNIITGINTIQEIDYTYKSVNYQIKLQTN